MSGGMGTSRRERILAVMRGEVPDRIPIQLGITNMFSLRQRGYKAWDVFLDGAVPYWKVVTDTARRFGLDGYLYLSLAAKHPKGGVTEEWADVERGTDRIVRRRTVHTPKGDLFEETTYLERETPAVTRGLVKSADDFRLWLDHCVRDDLEYAADGMATARAYLGEDGTTAGCVGIPGLASLAGLFDGRLENATYFAADHPALLDEYREKQERAILREVAALLEAPVDYVQIGSSGMLTLSSPDLFRRLCLPTIVKACALCAQAGVLTELHCCGRERLVVEACYRETSLSSINPLQPPPMGDCDLAEIKKSFGDRLCLKGNVGTTYPLLLGTPDDVEREVIRCIEAAKRGGRYILFSEEGIGAETPAANVERFVSAGLYYGRYV